MNSPSRAVKKTSKSFKDLPPIRVRREPPTVVEAVAAARDLADDVDQQIEIAAGLIGMPVDEVRPHVEAAAKAQPLRSPERLYDRGSERVFSPGSPTRPPRAVVVERRSRPVMVERRSRPLEPRR